MLETITSCVLSYYEPNFHFVKSVNPLSQDGTSTGTFQIPKQQYTKEDSKALSGACSVILATQIVLITFCENLYLKKFPGLEAFCPNNLEDIKNLCEHIVVRSYDEVKFKKVIWKNEPNNTFESNFTDVIIKSADLFFLKFSYSLSNKKHMGNWTIAFVKNKFDNPLYDAR